GGGCRSSDAARGAWLGGEIEGNDLNKRKRKRKCAPPKGLASTSPNVPAARPESTRLAPTQSRAAKPSQRSRSRRSAAKRTAPRCHASSGCRCATSILGLCGTEHVGRNIEDRAADIRRRSAAFKIRWPAKNARHAPATTRSFFAAPRRPE